MTELTRLTGVLEHQIQSTDSQSSEAGTQRERNYERYTGAAIGNEQRGRSHFQSWDVLDVVESKKAYFIQTFLTGRQPCKFMPTEGESQQAADLKTAYVNRQLSKNEWPTLFRDGLHDAFVAKRCVYHIEWLDDEDITIINLEGATPQHLQWQLQNTPDVTGMDGSGLQQGEDGLLYGTARLFTDASKVCIKLIQPERYYRDRSAAYPDGSAYCTYEEDATRSELVEQGYSEEQIDGLAQDYRFRREEEDNSRRAHDSSWTQKRLYNRAPENELITTYWTYTRLNMSEYVDEYPDETRLWKIRWTRGEVLEYADGGLAIEEVAEMPFFEWTQYKISHADSGMCDADITSDIQKTNSTLKRLVIDNQQMVNNSRMVVQVGAVKNERDLYDTTIGGVVYANRPDAVTPLAQAPLSPLTMQAIEMLERDKEMRTGSTRLGKGMNQDAMSQQNAASMIDRLTNSADRRIMAECRDYAEFMARMMKQIYRLGVRHDQRMYQLEVSGQQMQASPQQWQEPAPECIVKVALTPEEGAKQANALMQAHMMMSQDPMLGQLYGVKQRHALMDDLFDYLGVSDTSAYMIVPGSPEHQQQMQQQAQQAEQQMMQQQAMMQMQQQLLQSNDQREWQKVKLDEAKLQLDSTDTLSDNMRADDQLEHTKVIDFAKLGVERTKANASKT